MMGDISRGDTLKMAAKRHLKEAGRNLTEKATTQMKTMIGYRKNNKKRELNKKSVSCKRAKKHKPHDIFS